MERSDIPPNFSLAQPAKNNPRQSPGGRRAAPFGGEAPDTECLQQLAGLSTARLAPPQPWHSNRGPPGFFRTGVIMPMPRLPSYRLGLVVLPLLGLAGCGGDRPTAAPAASAEAPAASNAKDAAMPPSAGEPLAGTPAPSAGEPLAPATPAPTAGEPLATSPAPAPAATTGDATAPAAASTDATAPATADASATAPATADASATAPATADASAPATAPATADATPAAPAPTDTTAPTTAAATPAAGDATPTAADQDRDNARRAAAQRQLAEDAAAPVAATPEPAAATPAPAPMMKAAKATTNSANYQSRPVAGTHSTYLVDRTVPAFGVTWDMPITDDNRAVPICFEIHQGLGELETRLMTTGAGGPADRNTLIDYQKRLDAFVAAIGNPTAAEHESIDATEADLQSAADAMSLTGMDRTDTLQRDAMSAVRRNKTTDGKTQVNAPAPAAAVAAPATAAPAPAADATAAAPAPDASAPAPVTGDATAAAPASGDATAAAPADAGKPLDSTMPEKSP